jgi:hypothetical protein
MLDTGYWLLDTGYEDTAAGGLISEFVESG